MALLAVIGHPISHSASPYMHNAVLRALGLAPRYIAADVPPDQLQRALETFHALGFRGLNVTAPLKEAAAKLATRLSEEARLIGAVNTLVRDGDWWAGFNTDATGVGRCLAPYMEGVEGALILGAGGSAAASLYALARMGVARVVVANRDRRRAESLAERSAGWAGVGVEVVGLWEAAKVAPTVDLIVNATPLGLSYFESPLGPRDLKREHRILDMVYSRAPTPLERAAREAGSTYIGGARVLVEQGAEAFRLFTGVEPAKPLMEAAVYAWLGRRA